MPLQPRELVLLGHPVSHSLSPLFQNAAIRAAGIAATYGALDVHPDDLRQMVESLRGRRVAGNVTIPHKRAFAALCDRLTDIALRTGAVNTFWFDKGELVGDNTDVAGFHAAVRSLLGREPSGERVFLIGAGGAAAAVLAAVEGWPASQAWVMNRSAHRRDALVARFSGIALPATDYSPAAEATVVVNATSVGLRGTDLPIPAGNLAGSAAVLDLVYSPQGTELVRAARRAGLRAADGSEMLLEQGAQAFVRWFGTEPDRTVMREALGWANVGG